MMMAFHYRYLAFCICALLWLVATVTVQAQIGVDTGPQHELELGRQLSLEVERTLPVSADTAEQARVQRIGASLVAALDIKAYPYTFKVLTSKTVNAFSLPGGFIYIYEGLLQKLPDDNALAMVLGHELTHAAHRHWAHLTDKMKGVQLFTDIAGIALGDRTGLLAGLTQSLIGLSYSRENEEDADCNGLTLLWKAGYDLQGADEVMKVLADLEKGHSAPQFLSDHPLSAERTKVLADLAIKLRATPRPVSPNQAPPVAIDLTGVTGDVHGFSMMPNPWFPLAVDNSWTYQIAGSKGPGPVYTFHVLSALTVPNGTLYRAETSFGKTPISCQILTTANEIWRRSKPNQPDSVWRLEHALCLPNDTPCTYDGYTYTVIGTESVDLPCGTFQNARHIRKQGGEPATTTDLWFVANIGLVKRVVAEGTSEVLTSYTVAPIVPAVVTSVVQH